jgi:hypothetical protein
MEMSFRNIGTIIIIMIGCTIILIFVPIIVDKFINVEEIKEEVKKWESPTRL